jgi:hypothetical protein
VVNLTLPMASSSEAVGGRSIEPDLGGGRRTRVERRLQDGQTVVLQHVQERLPARSVSGQHLTRKSTPRAPSFLRYRDQGRGSWHSCAADLRSHASQSSPRTQTIGVPNCARMSQNQLMMNMVGGW